MKLFKTIRRNVTALFRYIFRFFGVNRKARRRNAAVSGGYRIVQWSSMGWWYRVKRGFRMVEPSIPVAVKE